jgi:hypothetical protein
MIRSDSRIAPAGNKIIVMIGVYLHEDKLRRADGFPSEHSPETANLLEELADKLLVVAGTRC